MIWLLGAAVALDARAKEDRHNSDATHDSGKSAEWMGDPYLLPNDPVSGQPLAAVAQQVVIEHQGREVRFASEDNARIFKADSNQYITLIDERVVAQQTPLYPLKTCVVSGETLGGAMGEPINFVYRNRLVRFCCKGCKRDFLKDSAAYVDKLDQAAATTQREHYRLDKCPVSGESLESMGKPFDRVFGNRLVRFCCKGCVKEFKKNPLKYLTQLGPVVSTSDKALGRGGATQTEHEHRHEHRH